MIALLEGRLPLDLPWLVHLVIVKMPGLGGLGAEASADVR